MADLDSILSGAGAVASEAPEPVTTEAAPAVTETQETQQQTGTEGEGGTKMVPHEALHAEKQKVKRYTEQVASFEKTMAEQAAAVRRLEQQLLTAVLPKKEEAKAPDFWENPDEFLKGAIAPLEQRLAEQAEKLSMRLAVKEHGRETVETAYSALGAAMQAGDPNARVEYQRIKASDDPYGDIVEWHKRQQAQAEIGGDPVAYREKLKAELLAELQAGTQQTQQAAQVMPTDLAGARNVGSRSGPAWSGPAPLNDIFKR